MAYMNHMLCDLLCGIGNAPHAKEEKKRRTHLMLGVYLICGQKRVAAIHATNNTLDA